MFRSARRRPSAVSRRGNTTDGSSSRGRDVSMPDPGLQQSVPAVRNLAPCPRLGRAEILDVSSGDPTKYAAGAVYVHVHARSVSEAEPAAGLYIEGRSGNTDTHVAPGGRHGELRLQMSPGQTYTSSVDVILPERLKGALAPSRLSMAVGCVVDGVTKWAYATSHRAPNEAGSYRLSVTYRLPENATEAWIRLIGGMTSGGGRVGWDRFQLTPTLVEVPYFDGDTADDRWYVYTWSGDPGASASVRTMRAPEESWPLADGAPDTTGVDPTIAADVFNEVERRARQLLIEEAVALKNFLDRVRGDGHDELSRGADILIAEARKRASAILSVDRPAPKVRTKYTNQLARLAVDARSTALASMAGRRLCDVGAWEAAIAPLRIAVDSSRDSMDAYWLAFALERTGQRGELVELVRGTARRETDPPFDVRKAAAIDVNKFAPRREVGQFLAEHLGEIRQRADHTNKLFLGGLGELPIFTYWGQGYENAPPVVRACRRALERLNPPEQLHFIDDASLPYYADFPDSLMAVAKEQRALFSDALRLELLARYGGIWLDATCLTTQPLAVATGDLARSPFFAFNYVESRVSSWFLAAQPGSRIVGLLRAALLTWFDKRQDLVDYYLIHHIFEMLYRLDDGFATEWDRGVRLSARPPHELQLAMYNRVDHENLQRLVASSFVHKLTHKLNWQHRQGFISPESYLAAVIRGA